MKEHACHFLTSSLPTPRVKKRKEKEETKQQQQSPNGCWAALKIGLSASGSVGPNFANPLNL